MFLFCFCTVCTESTWPFLGIHDILIVVVLGVRSRGVAKKEVVVVVVGVGATVVVVVVVVAAVEITLVSVASLPVCE